MTKEELEKEAEEYADKQVGCGDGYYEWTDIKQAYLASAGPREKRIAELTDNIREVTRELEEERFVTKDLKKQIEQMKRCEICKHYQEGSCNYHYYSQQVCKENGMKLFELRR